jgi:hypothetical protein
VRAAWGAALAALLMATGCLGVLDPMVGEPLAERCANVDSDPDREVSFARDVQPILLDMVEAQPGCSCHLPGAEDPIGLEETGLDLSRYEGLIKGGKNSLGGVVVPGAPCESVIWQKISAGPPFGARMPFNGPPFLDEATRQLISDWIAEGARDN